MSVNLICKTTGFAHLLPFGAPTKLYKRSKIPKRRCRWQKVKPACCHLGVGPHQIPLGSTASMQTAARLGRAALPVVGAGVATVISGPAHADAGPSAVLDLPRRRVFDDWQLADLKDESIVLFSAADIDNAVGMLTRPHQTAAIEEIDTSDCSSDGTVDDVIERNSYTVTEATSTSFGFDSSLFTVAARLLKSPGVQREIVSAALSDPEVFDILAGKMDLPGYLGSQGLAARGLLTGADAAVSMHGGVQDATPAQASDDSSTGLLDDMSAWAADCVEGLGHAVVRLGRWMRRTVSGQQGEEQAASSSAASANSRAAEDGAFLRRVGGGAVAVVAAMVAIIAVALLKKGRR